MLRIPQIALNDDPHIRPIAKFFLRKHRLKNRQRQVLGHVRFHIDVDMGSMPPRSAQERSQSGGDAAGRSFRIDRIELAVERESFTDTFTRGIGPRSSRSNRVTSGQAFTVGAMASIRSMYACKYRSASTSLVTASPRISSVKARLPSRWVYAASSTSLAEPPAMNRRALAAAPVRAAVASMCWAGPNPRATSNPIRAAAGSRVAHRPKILLQMPGDIAAIAEHRQHVDEAKHLHFHRFIAHGPFHEPLVPPAALQKREPPRVEIRKQPAADFLRRALDVSQIGGAEIGG